MVRMDYSQKIIEEFKDKDMYQTWGIAARRLVRHVYGVTDYPTLKHPCTMKREILQNLIPSSFNIDEILEEINIKQKEIARRLDISKLPSDRPTGWLGQTALYEILRDRGFDFKSYLRDWPEQWYQSQNYGYNLLMIFGTLTYIRRFFACPPIDIVKHIIEPIRQSQRPFIWDDNWVQRIMNNIYAEIPVYITNEHIYKIIRELMYVQDGRGPTTSRLMKWTGLSRSEASHIWNITQSGFTEHRFRLVSKNAGTVKLLRKSKSKWKTLPSFFSVCSSLDDDEDYFISVTDVFREDADEKFCEWEGFNTNVENFDLKEKIWKLVTSPHKAETVEDIHKLIQNGDHTIPDNDIPPTKRDMLFIALLLAMNTSDHVKKKDEDLQWLTAGYGIPEKEAEQGFRNVMRKNLLRNQHLFHAIMSPQREMFSILLDDKSEKVIPFLGDVLPSLPLFWLKTDARMGYGHLFDWHPMYLSQDIRSLIETSMSEHDVNGEAFLTKSWAFGFPGSILRLIDDT